MQGTYLASVVGNALGTSSKGTPSIKFQFSIQKNLINPAVEPEIQTLWGDLWLSPATMTRTLKTLEDVFGWSGDNLEELNEPIFAGKEVQLVTEDDASYPLPNGSPSTKIKWINKVGGGMKKAAAEDLANIVAQVGPLLKSIRTNAGYKSNPESAPLPEGLAAGDDMPF